MAIKPEFDPNLPYTLPILPPSAKLSQDRFLPLLLKARTELAELKGYAHSLPNPRLLMSPWILKEAVASSSIENINTTVVNALQMQLFPTPDQREPDKEVLRYREAIQWGFDQMADIPISSRLIRGIHGRLMATDPGFRRTQNTIQNSGTGEVLYTPPLTTDIPQLISNLENFIHDSDTPMDPLIKCALVHYQLEAIHPFGDGNGRTGRILIVLQLVHEGLLDYPILFISGFINRNRPSYYELLHRVTTHSDWEAFVEYMLRVFWEQAKATKEMLFRIMELYHNHKRRMKKIMGARYSTELLDALFTFPIITPTSLSEQIGRHRGTASTYLNDLVTGGILQDDMYGKYHLYINAELLDILDQG